MGTKKTVQLAFPTLSFMGSVHVCEPHTHTIRGPITHWHVY